MQTPLRFAFLMLEEHPWGRAMLRQLLKRGHIPGLVVHESSEISTEERNKFLERMAGQPVAPETAAQLAELGDGKGAVEQAWVQNHNDATCGERLAAFQPGLVVLGGTRIIRKRILEATPAPFVNAHPGLLPWLRGSASVGWALYLDQPVGATTHYIDPGIDTGDIILRRALAVRREDTYETLNYRVAELAAELMAETLDRFVQGSVPREPQDPSAGETYRVIPADLLEAGKARLREGRYAHFAPGETGDEARG